MDLYIRIKIYELSKEECIIDHFLFVHVASFYVYFDMYYRFCTTF